MSTTFFIAPFDPSVWNQSLDLSAQTPSDLRIDPLHYQKALQRRWAETAFTSDCIACGLEFDLPSEAESSMGLRGCLQANLQVVDFDTAPLQSFIDFILWHRAYVPSRFPLYLFNTASWDSLLLTRQTTEADVIEFTCIVA
jgi:hypothetical protein